MKIIWADSSGYCIAGDRRPTTTIKFPHLISYFDANGKIIYTTDRLKSVHSSSHDNCLVLGKTIFYLMHHQDNFGIHTYYIEMSLDEKGNVNEELRKVFEVKRSREGDKLNSEKYKFQAWKGSHQTKALLTYNNDYKEEYAEGFRYRTIDDKLVLSEEATFELPYSDRFCNVDDIIYDDANEKIYVLIDIFEKEGKKSRRFLRSAVASYDLKTKEYKEIDGIPSFNQSIVQHNNDGRIAFCGITRDTKDTTQWKLSAIEVDQENFSIKSSYAAQLPGEKVKTFFAGNRRLFDQFIHPVSMFTDAENTTHCFWNYNVTMDDIEKAENERARYTGAGTAAFGVAGFVVTLTLTEDMVYENKSNLWLQLKPSGVAEVSTRESAYDYREYMRLSFAPVNFKGKAFLAYNKSTDDTKHADCTFIKSDQQNDTAINSLLKDYKIFPMSQYKSENANYFLGRKIVAGTDYDRDAFCIIKME